MKSVYFRKRGTTFQLNIAKFYCICTKTDFLFLNRSAHFELTPHKKTVTKHKTIFSLFFSPSIALAEKRVLPRNIIELSQHKAFNSLHLRKHLTKYVKITEHWKKGEFYKITTPTKSTKIAERPKKTVLCISYYLNLSESEYFRSLLNCLKACLKQINRHSQSSLNLLCVQGQCEVSEVFFSYPITVP